MAERVPGLGQLTAVPRPVENPSFEGVQMTPEDWFLLSRVDGVADLKEIITLSPKDKEATIEILKKLLTNNFISLPGASNSSPLARTAQSVLLPSIPTNWPTSYDTFVFDEAIMAQDVGLSDDFKKATLYFHDHRQRVDYYTYLGVAQGSKAKDIRKAYFALSKVFHPDKFFRQDLGSFRSLLSEVFQWLNDAHKALSHSKRRAAYDKELASGRLGPWDKSPKASSAPTIKGESLKELLENAQALEAQKAFDDALAHYKEALRRKSSPEIMIRIAECQVRLRRDLDEAESLSRSAIAAKPGNARFHVALAFALELQGKTAEAIAEYERTLEIDAAHTGAKNRLARLKN